MRSQIDILIFFSIVEYGTYHMKETTMGRKVDSGNRFRHIKQHSALPILPTTTKIQHVQNWSGHIWILAYSLLPLALHQAWLSYTGLKSLTGPTVFIIYSLGYLLLALRHIANLGYLGRKYGYLDGDRNRRADTADFGGVAAFTGLLKTIIFRVTITVYLSYDHETSPAMALSGWKWWVWLTIEVGLYIIVLDFLRRI